MKETERRNTVLPDPLIAQPAGGRRCDQCGASALKIVENPVTKKLQCQMCGAQRA
jgi:hypothetical protein